ncbi:acyl-CoA dehydrogenase family protein [Pseudonocardia sp. WMMC193]|uniref:acyl-CoA dehydrogenase family protein n=1 Tax=Pseudonocardia sp. WMMC193 TaxID=2911965 RepID=UPI001F2A602B|nr:acyl-CoA dehydrogenase family protein [Pseudonocardia sp. WMMC193]MCF7553477.1 acyl-CoA/acyl-ACP dehydrogenase [Pseudonocardia sp. WMMC193]
MTLEPTGEQQDLRDTLRKFLADLAPGESPWAGLVELGLTEIPFASADGGADGTVKDAAVVVEELGRVLAGGPYLASIALAGSVLATASDRSALPALASGERVAALVSGVPAVRDGAVLRLDGAIDTVLGADTADVFVVVAGSAIAVVDAAAAEITPWDSLDLTRPLSRVRFAGVAAEVVGQARPVPATLALVAAEQLGSAQRCLDLAVEYARTREQFGRPIGSFQAIKHRLADLHVAVELARSAVLDAVGRPEDAVAAATARVLATRASTTAAEEAIQVHGGIGFTWEHELHRHFRRAVANAQLFTPVDDLLESVAAHRLAALP